MSLSRLVGLLLLISADVRKGLGQTLEPRCSNPEGIYMTEEGSAVEVCFTVFQGMVPQTVTFAIESTSNLGTVAIGRVDFMNDTVQVNVGPGDQDSLELCPVIEIFNDGLIEKTEYFTVFLREGEGANLAACQVAIIDIDANGTQVDLLPFTTAAVQNTSTVRVPADVTVQVTVSGTPTQGQTSAVPFKLVIIVAAVLGSVLGLILVGGAVALLIICLVWWCRRKSSPVNKGSIAAVQADVDDSHQMKSRDSNEYASIMDTGESAIVMKDNSAYMCSSAHGQDISTDYNVAYYSSNRLKHEDDHGYVYEYI